MRHVVIRGRVQGVGFRAWTEYTALELGLQGWVRNRRDGAVEALFVAGDLEECEALAWTGTNKKVRKTVRGLRRPVRGLTVSDGQSVGPDRQSDPPATDGQLSPPLEGES